MIIGVDIRPLMDAAPTGVGFYVRDFLDNLFKIDQENEYRLFYNSFHNVENRLPKWDYPKVKFYGYRWPNKILNLSFLLFNYPKVDKLLGGCDLFFLPNLCYIALSGDCRKIATVHDLSFEIYPEFLTSKKRLWHWLINPRRFFSSADKLIAVSEATRRDLVDLYGIDKKIIEVVCSGVSQPIAEGLQPIAMELPKRFILTLGTREPRKNLAGVVQAFEMIRGELREEMAALNLVIAGGGGWQNKEADELISKSEFKNDIKILGYVSEEEKVELYRRAQVFVYPSFYEGFGFPPLEAMRSGCPVVTSLSPATMEICGQAATYVDPYKVEELVAGISGLEDSETREEMIKQGHERIKEFDWQKTVKIFLDILR